VRVCAVNASPFNSSPFFSRDGILRDRIREQLVLAFVPALYIPAYINSIVCRPRGPTKDHCVDTLDRMPTTQRLFTENVIPQLVAWRKAGVGCALVTLVAVEGSSPRRLGSQMAVNAHGEHLGMISSGCAEAAIVAEAVAAIAAHATRTVRYGAGSPYIDVVLPCGSGIDVHFDATIATAELELLASDIAARRGPSYSIAMGTGREPYVRCYEPVPRIVIAGRGINVDFAARFAHDLEWDVVVTSPDEAALARLAPMARVFHLTAPSDFDASIIDRNTAVVLVFHDHDWEPAVLAKCSSAPAFYIGALGSRRTHVQRCALLASMGCEDAYIRRIHSPIGLDIGAKNPAELGLAIIAEILSAMHQRA